MHISSSKDSIVMKSGDFVSRDRSRDSATFNWYIYQCATDERIKV